MATKQGLFLTRCSAAKNVGSGKQKRRTSKRRVPRCHTILYVNLKVLSRSNGATLIKVSIHCRDRKAYKNHLACFMGRSPLPSLIIDGMTWCVCALVLPNKEGSRLCTVNSLISNRCTLHVEDSVWQDAVVLKRENTRTGSQFCPFFHLSKVHCFCLPMPPCFVTQLLVYCLN